MPFFSNAVCEQIRSDPSSISAIYSAYRTQFIAALDMPGLTAGAYKAAFCTVLAYDLVPYGPGPQTTDLDQILNAETIACAHYVSLAWQLMDLLGVPTDDQAAVGWDDGAVGNHAQLLFDDGQSRLLLDPTIGLVVNGATIEGLIEGAHYNDLASFYARTDISSFNTQVINAVQSGLYHVRDAIYYVPELDNWLNHYSSYQGLTLPQSGGSVKLVGSLYDDALNGTAFGDFIYGGKGNDIIDGGGGNDYIEGGKGHDNIDGAGGLDTVAFMFTRSSFSISGDAYNGVVKGSSTGTDLLSNVEYLKFSDQILPLTAHAVVQADTSDIYAWTESATNFDAAWRRLQVAYDYEDDRQYIYQYDALSQFSWKSVETTFDAQGHRPQVIYNNDNGTRAVYQYDLNDAFAWASVQTSFTGSQRDSIMYTNDDRSRVVYQYDTGDNFAWEQTARYFDDDGQKLRDVYDNDSGTHSVYEYDVAGNTTSVHNFNASWALIA